VPLPKSSTSRCKVLKAYPDVLITLHDLLDPRKRQDPSDLPGLTFWHAVNLVFDLVEFHVHLVLVLYPLLVVLHGHQECSPT
jgi:hypothetical protein